MTDEANYTLPVWSPRLRKAQIARLYEACGRGMIDEELIDDAGFSLYARAESILAATEASRGRTPCASCESVVEHTPWENELLKCLHCGWECPWRVYKKTIKYKNLNAGGMKPFLEEFVQKFPKARSHSDRLILIDTLVHRYHWESSSGNGRPGACCLIEGKLKDIMPFLDRLSYGAETPKEVEATREEWRKKWRKNKWKGRVEQMVARGRLPGNSG